MEHSFVLLNVFAIERRPFSGNPLCVVERADGLSADEMQAIARQFNLSETTFVLPASRPEATRRVRIFTPSFEMPFAGHPTLGTAQVVRALTGIGDRLVLEMNAGLVEVIAHGDEWTLGAAHPPQARPAEATNAELAAMLGLAESAIGAQPMWVDTGAEQLVIPLRSVEDVRAARPDGGLLAKHGFTHKRGASMAYVWASSPSIPDAIEARFFFISGGVVEDPATGSACANLGGWMIATGQNLPIRLHVSQGDAVGRPSRLDLHVDEDRHVFVSGRVVEVGRGTFTLRA